MARAPRPQRGEIWTVQFDPSVGAEIRKLRPAVVANVDSIGRLPLRIVVPLTDWQSSFGTFPWFVYVPSSPTSGLTKDSGADAFQVKSVSENRLVRRIGNVTDDQMDEIAAAIALCVGAP
ncbi:MAG: type II toxin-antitoxin system PemK/MazF family toxin [Pirellulales bacterium]